MKVWNIATWKDDFLGLLILQANRKEIWLVKSPKSLDLSLFIFKDFILFLEGKGGSKRERNIVLWLPLVGSQLGTWPATQACALTGNRTRDPFALQSRAQSTEPCQPGLNGNFLNKSYGTLIITILSPTSHNVNHLLKFKSTCEFSKYLLSLLTM